MSNNETGGIAAPVELDRAYAVTCDGMGCGTNSVDVIICKPSELDEWLNEMAWAHHEQWFEPDEDDEESDGECQACASAVEYTPENMGKWDSQKSGGGSFLCDEYGVLAVWQALGYGRAKFEGSDLRDCVAYVKQWNIPICQAGVSWQELDNWNRQSLACKDVIRVLGLLKPHSTQHMPPLLMTQCGGAVVMAENELKLFDANVQKVVARLKAL